jgi:hypothetical protein
MTLRASLLLSLALTACGSPFTGPVALVKDPPPGADASDPPDVLDLSEASPPPSRDSGPPESDAAPPPPTEAGAHDSGAPETSTTTDTGTVIVDSGAPDVTYEACMPLRSWYYCSSATCGGGEPEILVSSACDPSCADLLAAPASELPAGCPGVVACIVNGVGNSFACCEEGCASWL